MQSKAPGARTLTQPVDLNFDFESALGHRREACERLLDDALDGRRHRFARGHDREEWRIVDPILDLPDWPVPYYYKGTWGPPPAHAPADGWHDMALRT